MRGFDPAKQLRDVLGAGQVATLQSLKAKLAAFDANQEGALTRDELALFFRDSGVGGIWYSGVLTRELFEKTEEDWGVSVDKIPLDFLAETIQRKMARQTPDSREQVTAEAIRDRMMPLPESILDDDTAVESLQEEEPKSAKQPKNAAAPTKKSGKQPKKLK